MPVSILFNRCTPLRLNKMSWDFLIFHSSPSFTWNILFSAILSTTPTTPPGSLFHSSLTQTQTQTLLSSSGLAQDPTSDPHHRHPLSTDLLAALTFLWMLISNHTPTPPLGSLFCWTLTLTQTLLSSSGCLWHATHKGLADIQQFTHLVLNLWLVIRQ